MVTNDCCKRLRIVFFRENISLDIIILLRLTDTPTRLPRQLDTNVFFLEAYQAIFLSRPKRPFQQSHSAVLNRRYVACTDDPRPSTFIEVVYTIEIYNTLLLGIAILLFVLLYILSHNMLHETSSESMLRLSENFSSAKS